MDRLVNPPVKLAAALLAVASLLALSPGLAGAQQVVFPPRDGAQIPIPNPIIIKREARAATVIRAPMADQVPAGLMIPGGQLQPVADPEQVARQALQDFRPTFQKELRLLTTAAGPTPDQRREIAIEAARSLRENLRNVAKANPFNQPNNRMAGILNNDPAKLVRTHLELAAWTKLSNVQSARYRSELDRKEQARRDVVVLNVVAGLDRRLNLDAAQREKLCESIRSSWDDRDFPMFESMIPYDEYIPTIPNQSILFILTEEQRKVWRSLRKVHLSSVRGVDPLDTVLPIGADVVEPDEDVKAALDGEAKR